MAIQLVKVDAEEATNVLNSLVVEGFELKNKLDFNYAKIKAEFGGFNNSRVVELLKEVGTEYEHWKNKTMGELDRIFSTRRQYHEFFQARYSPGAFEVIGESQEWYVMSNRILIKVRQVAEFDDLVNRVLHVNITYVGRDQIRHDGIGDINIK